MKHERPVKPSTGKETYKNLLVISIIVTVSILAGLYLFFAWNRYHNMFADEAIKLAESLGTLLPESRISRLAEETGDPESLEYDIIRERLIRLVDKTGLVHYAYLMGQKDGKTVILVDSRPGEISPYSPLDGFNERIPNRGWIPFETDGSILTKPFYNQWGSWVRALVPIKDPESGKIIAILGLSYSATEWSTNIRMRMVPDIAVAFSLFTLLLAFLWILSRHKNLKEKSRQLAFDEGLYRNLFKQAPIGITLTNHSSNTVSSGYVSANPMAEQILGRNIHQLRTTDWVELTDPESLPAELELFEQFKNRQIEGYTFEKRILKPDKSSVWVNVKVSSFMGREGVDFTYLCLIEDISARKAAEEALKESERSKAVLLSHLPGMAYRSRYDRHWTLEFASEGCRTLTGYSPESLVFNRDLSFNDIVSPEYRRLLWEKWTSAIEQGKTFRYEYEIIAKDGEHKWVLEMGQGIYGQNGKVKALEGIILDISTQKKRDAQITHLSERVHKRDFLTGLYNRNYLEQAKERLSKSENLPLSIAICDINGLRMINDAYGQAQGDRLIMETAKLLQDYSRPANVLGRTSGGEFMLLMPGTSSEKAHEIIKGILAKIESFNRSRQNPTYEISLTIGHSTIESEDENIDDAVKAAERYLNHRKLLNQKSLYHSILSSIMATLYAKSQETEEHGQRLGQYAALIGELLGLDQKALDDLHLLSMLHDIGKIGIDDRILNKPDKLTAEEWTQMKKHPEIWQRFLHLGQ